MLPEFREIPIAQLHESPKNPRRHWSEAGLAELTASVRQHGVLTPLLVRPNATGFEIAAGHRRLRAATPAGLATVPARIREMDDRAFLEVLTIENLQREDVHPLDEAEGYQALMTVDRAYTPEAIAAKVGKSTSYVYQRLKLLSLIPQAKQAFQADTITAGHAVRLARLTPEQQRPALEECFYPIFRPRRDDADVHEPAPLSKLDAWIDSHVRIDLRAPDTQHYFPELAEQVAVEQTAGTVLELSDSHHVNVDLGTKKHGAIGRGRWTPIRTARDRCDHVQKGVVVHGGPMRLLEVCATKGCRKHFPARASAGNGRAGATGAREAQEEKAKAEREAEERARKAWEQLLPQALAGFVAHVKSLPVTPELVKLVLGTWKVKEIEKLTGPVTSENLGQALAVSLLRTYNRQMFLEAVKPFKFNLGAVEQAEKKRTTTAAARPKAPAAKRRA